MSLPLVSTFTVPERTAEIAHAVFPKGNRYMQMRDTLGTVYTNASFAGSDIHVMLALRRNSCQIVVTDEELDGPAMVGELLGKGQRLAYQA
jgi:hypothetical protein